MIERIERDRNRYKEIVERDARKDLKKYITDDSFIGKKGKDLVSIPVPQIELPSFRFWEGAPGAGQGEGDQGEITAGNLEGVHILEAEVTIDELTNWFKDEIELPNILPKGTGNIKSEHVRSKSVQIPKASHLLVKRAFKEALKETNDPGEAILLAQSKPHARYRSYEEVPVPHAQAVMIYLMDVSGSMSDYLKGLARHTAYWMDNLIDSVYPNVDTRYIIHDATAKEVDEHAFYHTKVSGGTKISSAYQLASKMIDEEYSPDDWNIFITHFSDGENDIDDDAPAIKIFSEELLPQSRFFAFANVRNSSMFGGAAVSYVNKLQQAGASHRKESIEQRYAYASIVNRYEIYDAITTFIGKKK